MQKARDSKQKRSGKVGSVMGGYTLSSDETTKMVVAYAFKHSFNTAISAKVSRLIGKDSQGAQFAQFAPTKNPKLPAAAQVIPPFLTGFARRIYAANFSFWAGVMPPMPMLGRSLL